MMMDASAASAAADAGFLSAQSVASLPPPGLNGPTNVVFAPNSSRYLAYVSSTTTTTATTGAAGVSATAATATTATAVTATRKQQPQPAFYQPLVTGFSTAGAGAAGVGNNGGVIVNNNNNRTNNRNQTTTTTTTPNERVLMCLDLEQQHSKPTETTQPQPQQQLPQYQPRPLLRLQNKTTAAAASGTATTTVQPSESNQQQRSKRRLLESNSPTGSNVSDTTPPVPVPTATFTTATNTTSTTTTTATAESLQERLRRERQRMHLTQFGWAWRRRRRTRNNNNNNNNKQEEQKTVVVDDDDNDQRNDDIIIIGGGGESDIGGGGGERIQPGGGGSDQHQPLHQQQQQQQENQQQFLKVLVPARGSLWIQDGVLDQSSRCDGGGGGGGDDDDTSIARLLHDKTSSPNASAIDPQLSPDGRMVAWTQADGELYVKSTSALPTDPAVRLTYGAKRCNNNGNNTNSNSNSTATATTTGNNSNNNTNDNNNMDVDNDEQQGTNAPNNNNNNNNCSQNQNQYISYGVADFVAQEEMDRYRGYWWNPTSTGILLTKVDESHIPIYRILHHNVSTSASASASTTASASGVTAGAGATASADQQQQQQQQQARQQNQTHEDHHYPFAGKRNPIVTLGYVQIDAESIMNAVTTATSTTTSSTDTAANNDNNTTPDGSSDTINEQQEQQSGVLPCVTAAQTLAVENWKTMTWFERPREASEYLARIWWLKPQQSQQQQPGNIVIAQWQNRLQNVSVLQRLDIAKGKGKTLLVERSTDSDGWINLHHMFHCLKRPIHPSECNNNEQQQQQALSMSDTEKTVLPPGSFSFVWASERTTGYMHLYLYTYIAGQNNDMALMVKQITHGEWVVESISGCDIDNDRIYFTGTFDSVLERHLYVLPLTGRKSKLAEQRLSEQTQQQQLRQGVDDSDDEVMMARHHMINTTTGSGAVGGGLGGTPAPATAAAAAIPTNASSTSTTTSSTMRLSRGLTKMITAFGVGGGGVTSTANNNGNTRQHVQQQSSSSSLAGQRWLQQQFPSTSNTMLQQQQHPSTTSIMQQRPVRLTIESGTHSIVMDESCRYFVDTSSDINRPMSTKIYELLPEAAVRQEQQRQSHQPLFRYVMTLFDAASVTAASAQQQDGDLSSTTRSNNGGKNSNNKLYINNSSIPLTLPVLQTLLPPPEILSFPTTDGSETLYASLYKPDPRKFGPGPYPLICAVYGGPHVQRVQQSWGQTSADMRAQRLRSLGFCVVKCDNRGSARRGHNFEKAISRRLGRIEVLDQVACVRQLIVRGYVDPTRVGIYGWSYGGYLASMCLFRAPDVFKVAVAGAPVTSWDGYDTHYTERYMGLPADNPAGYRESAVFDHVGNMHPTNQKLMLVHGLIDENVHFRHTTRLIQKLIACGKDYELLIFPDERHSPRRLRDRIYMEQRISDFFIRHLSSSAHHSSHNHNNNAPSAFDLIDSLSRAGGLQSSSSSGYQHHNNNPTRRAMAGHL